MNHSEYLRRKVEAMPKVYGPAKIGDASELTRMRGMIAAAAGSVRSAPSSGPACCAPRSRTVRLPSGVIFYDKPTTRPMGPGGGLSEDRTESGRALVAAGCALLGAARAGWPTTPATKLAGCIPTGEIREACCPPESIPEQPRDAAGNLTDPTKKAFAYQGRETCCPIQGPPLQDLDPATLNHCCRTPGNGDTVTMNDVPLGRLPLVPAEKAACCPAPAPPPEDCYPF